MNDPIEIHKKKTKAALRTLRELIRTLTVANLLGEGKIKVEHGHSPGEPPTLIIPLNSIDYFIWDEILHDE